MDEKTALGELKRRFAVLKDQPPAPSEPQSEVPARKAATRRRDYKGERQRLNLRLPLTLTDDLAVLCLAAGVDKNAFCEKVLSQAITNQLGQLRAQFSPQEWEGILRCAHKAGRGK
jgi:hypothetical protein